MAQRAGRSPRPDAADPGELDHQAAVSAELAPGQLDTDSLPDYEVLDALLDDYVEQDLGRDDLIAAGHDPELVAAGHPAGRRRRVQAPPVPAGPEDQPKNFGRDRRLPITNSWREPPPGQTKAPEDSVPDDAEPPNQLGAR